MQKTCIIIAGPTAVGKTAVSLALARHFSNEVISADSRQCYRELNIGVAKPSAAELAEIPHHFINSHSINENITAAGFEKFALAAAESVFKKNDMVVMVGGTGLYIKAFSEGLDPVPASAEGIKKEIEKGYAEGGLPWLQQKIRALDPGFASAGDIHNPRRVMRALEVVMSTGKSILSFHSSPAAKRDFKIIKIALDLPREELYQRINARVDEMMRQGLEEEAFSLRSFRHLPALQTVGYRELFDYFDGKTDLARAVELIKQNSRHYAKRQLTWFRNSGDFVFLPPVPEEVLKLMEGV